MSEPRSHPDRRWNVRLAIRFLRWHAIRTGRGCPCCGKPITKDSSWAEIEGEIWHGDCVLAVYEESGYAGLFDR